jgi:hypothetical protein
MLRPMTPVPMNAIEAMPQRNRCGRARQQHSLDAGRAARRKTFTPADRSWDSPAKKSAEGPFLSVLIGELMEVPVATHPRGKLPPRPKPEGQP